MFLPDFLIVGAAKSGTTTLYEYLSAHPGIFLPALKEPRFLALESWPRPPTGPGDREMFAHACTTLPAYAALFAKSAPSQKRGEASADTLYYYSTAIPKIRTLFGNPRIIILLRAPAARAFSAYAHLRRDGREQLSFADALAAEPDRIAQGYEFLWHYRAAGHYLTGVQAFRAAFSNVLLLDFEVFIKNPLPDLEKICLFLKIDPAHRFAARPSSNSSGLPTSRALFDTVKNPAWWKAPLKALLPAALRRRMKDRLLTSFLQPLTPEPEILASLAREFEPETAQLAKLFDQPPAW